METFEQDARCSELGGTPYPKNCIIPVQKVRDILMRCYNDDDPGAIPIDILKDTDVNMETRDVVDVTMRQSREVINSELQRCVIDIPVKIGPTWRVHGKELMEIAKKEKIGKPHGFELYGAP